MPWLDGETRRSFGLPSKVSLMTRNLRSMLLAALLGASALVTSMPAAGKTSLSVRNSFRVGSEGVICSAQFRALDPRLKGIFDRAYGLTCRDAASPVGTLIAVRSPVDLAHSVSGQKCEAETIEQVDGIGSVRKLSCRDEAQSLDHHRYAIERGNTQYLVEGLAGYDSVLRLALASIVNDRPQVGLVRVATTMISDPAAFARIQAGAMEASGTRTEGYLRNHGGAYAESAEFFDSLAARSRTDPLTVAEALANLGLQQSNLGNHAAAETLFGRAARLISPRDPLLRRQLRNYRATAELNRQSPVEALAQLVAPMPEVEKDEERNALRTGLINEPISLELNGEGDQARQLKAMDSVLTTAERVEILDAQAQGLVGTAYRQQKKLAEAARELTAAVARIRAVRRGRVISTKFLLSEIAMERALVLEASGDGAGAIAGFDGAIAEIANAYPQSPSLLSARARKAALLARLGDKAGAAALFAEVVATKNLVPDGGVTLRGLLGPYFAILAERGDADAAKAMFSAAQARQRPGVAQTQAVLARQFSEGNDEGSALFRLTLARTREIARGEQDLTILKGKSQPTVADRTAIADVEQNLNALREQQTGLQSRLAAFPRYVALGRGGVELADLQAKLRPGEAYWQLIDTLAGLFGMLITPTSAKVYRSPQSRRQLNEDVRAIRDSIARSDQGQVITDPFDLERSYGLFQRLMGPIASELAAVKHLIVEPDGALLQLPLSLLITDRAGIDAYQARQKLVGADEFDFRGIRWLGRGRQISTAVGPRSFLDVRAVPASRAKRLYLGLGGNAVPPSKPIAAVTDGCEWPLSAWQAPIATEELKRAAASFGNQRSELMIGAAFSDSALLADKEVGDFRVLHFATHGLVTAPRPDCPARPALLTSFGDQNSDGLLTFKEIFDLKLDADVVILSACDTAGLATVAASREAGVTSGGNYALDGLVRAFVGAGARSVVASHWPVPDDYGATRRLMGGLLGGDPGEPLAASLARAQLELMDDRQTSHPFYWAAFILLGDGSKPLVPANIASVAAGPSMAGR